MSNLDTCPVRDRTDGRPQPHGRVVLAGEHSEFIFGYVESALASGRTARVAVERLL